MKAPCVVSVTVNLHGTTVERRESDADLFGSRSYGKYTFAVGAQRLFAMLEAQGIRATVFVPGAEAEAHPDFVRGIVARGHEIAAHGFAMESYGVLEVDEARWLARTHEILTGLAGVPPRGWRAPLGRLSSHTLASLAALGYAYDGSFQDDDLPYRLDPDGGRGMLELPQNEVLIDATYYGAWQTQTRVLQHWREEVEALHAERLGICMTLHPRSDYGSGRASRVAALGGFLHWLRELPDVTFMTCSEISESIRAGSLPCRE
jgi:peptidoglycan-N-acetylglucosamine deacetylase